MRIAITYENEEVFQHFGRTPYFKIYDIENNEVVSEELLFNNGRGHSALADILKDNGVEALICGGIGVGARARLEQAGISLYPGAHGNADEIMRSFLKGELSYDPGTKCDHHEHNHDHDCDHEDCCH